MFLCFTFNLKGLATPLNVSYLDLRTKASCDEWRTNQYRPATGVMMETSQSSQSSKISHSTPKGTSSPASQPLSRSTPTNTKSKYNSKSHSPMRETSYGSNTFQSSSRSFENPSASPRPKNSSADMNETGESTRSLLSVLSHSSIDSLSTGSLTNSSTTSSPARRGTEPQKDNPNTDISKDPEQNNGNDKESPLTPWEKWLIEKSKLERKKVREEVRQKLADLKAKEEEEEKQKERRRYIEGQVRDWLRAKEKDEKQQRAKQDRKKRREQKEKILVKQKRVEKDKTKRQEWLCKKKEEEKKLREKAQEEKQRTALEERMRQEKADEAFKKWKKQAKNKPKPATGSFYDTGNLRGNLHSASSYYNPVPWMPNEIPAASKPGKSSGSSTKRKISKKRENEIIQSPPLLFKDRSNNDTFKKWGRPR
ncbi:uncharacterized protein [Apostichopus japonicus]|uniref:uncharacterized protein isoform X1 n=2 Tax=Stichopus japonicus TaxID=307972 RepID=UPI003AB8A607